jgi:glycosyltransferase involved in cell wall biosynthesis
MKKNLSVIVPAYNEEGTILEIINKLINLNFVAEIVVVDDCSKDDTYKIVSEIGDERIKLFKHKKNKGKTAAIKTALQNVSQEIVIIQDADLEYDPDEIIHVCEPIWAGKADVVYGSRFLVRKAARVLYFYHYLANKFLTFLSDLFTNLNMTDIETCYKAFRTPILKNMPITSKGFGFEAEVTANISKTKAKVYETPISYYGRTYEEGKKIGFTDGVLALLYIVRYNVFPSRNVKKYINEVNEFLSERQN